MELPIKLVGIARLAAEGSLLVEKRRVEYRSLPSRSWLNRCQSGRVPFDWTINPYRGCEYGCKYCYARFTHEFLERHDPQAFETEIYAKQFDKDEFRRELKRLRPGDVIGFGTATDPYQPAERRFGLSRQVLEGLVGLRGISIFVTTKSDLASRDADLLRRLSEHNEVRVTFSVTTMDRNLAKLIEPFAPRPDLRMNAVAELTLNGVSCGVIASPVLPLITDSFSNLERVALAAKAAGAEQFGANVLFLKPCSERVFFPFLEDKFPEQVGQYRRMYGGNSSFVKGHYPDRIRERVETIRRSVGIGHRDLRWSTPPASLPVSQMQLF